MLGSSTHTKKVSKARKTTTKGPYPGLANPAMFKNAHTQGDKNRAINHIHNAGNTVHSN